MPIETINISYEKLQKILETTEGHFHDVKAIEIPAGKLTRTLAAFANAEGGELFIGIDDIKATQQKVWRGFANEEAANGHLQAFEALFPLGSEFDYTFLRNAQVPGLVLQASIHKTVSTRTATDGNVYVRRSAINNHLITEGENARW